MGNAPLRKDQIENIDQSQVNGLVDIWSNSFQSPNGFPNHTDSEILYDPITREIKIQPKAPATEFDYYIKNIKYTINSAQNKFHPDTTNIYFFYWDSTNTLLLTTTPWNLITDVPIAYIIYNATLVDGFHNEERHHSRRNPEAHLEFHEQIGTYAKSGFTIADYVVQPVTPVDDDNTFSLTSGVIKDEDIEKSLSTLPDDGPYTVFYRDGATGEWRWDKTRAVPYFAGTYIQYNQYTGAVWQLTDLAINNYVNYYVAKVPSLDSLFETVIFPGQQVYTSLENALGESFSELLLGSFPFQEIAPIYQITFRTSAAYSSTGKTRIESEPVRIVGSKAIIIQGAQANHNALTGLQGGQASQYFHLDESKYNQFTTNILTANRLLNTDGSNNIASVADLTGYVAGTTNQVIVTDDTDGTITLSLPQNIAVGSSVQFGQIGIKKSDPDSILHVVGDGGIDGYIQGDGSQANERIRLWTSTNHWCVDNNAGSLRLFTETGIGVGGDIKMNITSIGNVTKPDNVEFNVYRSFNADNYIGGSAWYPVPYSNERIDNQDKYHTTGYYFTAPVTGRYLFTFSCGMSGFDNTNTRLIMRLLTSNKGYWVRQENPWVTKPTGGEFIISDAVYADLDSGDTAMVDVFCNGNRVIELLGEAGGLLTWYTGCLIQ